jgi:hypothetical protein
VQCSFSPRLTGKGKEYCKRGHDLKDAFARRLLDDSSKLNGIQEIYKTGLVRKKGCEPTEEPTKYAVEPSTPVPSTAEPMTPV